MDMDDDRGLLVVGCALWSGKWINGEWLEDVRETEGLGKTCGILDALGDSAECLRRLQIVNSISFTNRCRAQPLT
jgi:hypothetical protein